MKVLSSEMRLSVTKRAGFSTKRKDSCKSGSLAEVVFPASQTINSHVTHRLDFLERLRCFPMESFHESNRF